MGPDKVVMTFLLCCTALVSTAMVYFTIYAIAEMFLRS